MPQLSVVQAVRGFALHSDGQQRYLASALAMEVDSSRSTNMTTAARPNIAPVSLMGIHLSIEGGGRPAIFNRQVRPFTPRSTKKLSFRAGKPTADAELGGGRKCVCVLQDWLNSSPFWDWQRQQSALPTRRKYLVGFSQQS